MNKIYFTNLFIIFQISLRVGEDENSELSKVSDFSWKSGVFVKFVISFISFCLLFLWVWGGTYRFRVLDFKIWVTCSSAQETYRICWYNIWFVFSRETKWAMILSLIAYFSETCLCLFSIFLPYLIISCAVLSTYFVRSSIIVCAFFSAFSKFFRVDASVARILDTWEILPS